MESFSWHNSLLTSSFTLTGGVILFIGQQLLQNFVFTPMKEQRQVIEDIEVALVHYANLYCNPMNYGAEQYGNPLRITYTEASMRTRELSAILRARTNRISWYKCWWWLISKNDIESAAQKLIGLSNSYNNVGKGKENFELAKSIRELLLIPESV